MSWLRGRLEIERSEYDIPHAVLYRLNGSLIDTHESYELLDDVRKELRDGFRIIILDLKNVRRVTSAGIGLLAACYTSARNTSGHLVVIHTPEHTRTLLQLVHLWDVISHYESVDEALAALQSWPENVG